MERIVGKKCDMCQKTSGMMLSMMGITRCSDCMKKEMTKENYSPQTALNKAANNLKKISQPKKGQ